MGVIDMSDNFMVFLQLFIINLNYESHLTTKVISVFGGMGYGWDNFATTNNSSLSLYKPIDVAYGLKSEPVMASMYDPDVPDFIALGFRV